MRPPLVAEPPIGTWTQFLKLLHPPSELRPISRMEAKTGEVQEDEMTATEKRFKQDRTGGNYGEGTKEVQERNYQKRKEAEKEREDLFEKALRLFADKDLEAVPPPASDHPSGVRRLESTMTCLASYSFGAKCAMRPMHITSPGAPRASFGLCIALCSARAMPFCTSESMQKHLWA